MIRLGDCPEEGQSGARRGVNKFVGVQGEGHRGVVVALHESKRRAVVLALTASAEQGGGVVWGALYLVRERAAGHWPQVVRRVGQVPASPDWEVVALGAYERAVRPLTFPELRRAGVLPR